VQRVAPVHATPLGSLAISLEPIKRQFTDFANAIKQDRRPNCAGEDGYRALEVVLKTYESAREGKVVRL
jgi:predicted dehydrogenase